MSEDLFIIEDCLLLVVEAVGVPVYDFDFRQFFTCRSPREVVTGIAGVARVGAFPDYPGFFEGCRNKGVGLVHSAEDHLRCTSLPCWYPLIEEHTPRSRSYEGVPFFDELEAEFGLPFFVKGARQTSRHQAAASVIRSREDFEQACRIFQSDPILRWQDFVCRELVELRPVAGGTAGKIAASFEFRTFWWRGALVGEGRYWSDAKAYDWTKLERVEALEVARHAVGALGCTFLVVDLAQTLDGRWIIIECNDGMESGYAGASPFALWENILSIEKQGGRSLSPALKERGEWWPR